MAQANVTILHVSGRTLVRRTYLALAGVTILVGLLIHAGVFGLTPVARDVAGDALWAMMIAWWCGVFWPTSRLLSRGVGAWAFCGAVEVSQLYHAPALDALRSTTVGHLVLGSGFDLRDLGAYPLGILVAALIEVAFTRRR